MGQKASRSCDLASLALSFIDLFLISVPVVVLLSKPRFTLGLPVSSLDEFTDLPKTYTDVPS